jgi:hypothetical protein
MTSQKDLDRIKEIGDALPKRLKIPNGAYSIIITDKMREEYGRAYLEEEKRRKKENE